MHGHEADEALLQTLEQLGVDFKKAREVNFYFLFPTEQDASAAQDILKQKNLESERIKIDPPWWKRLFARPQWAVSVTRNMALDRKKIMSMTTSFEGIATQCNGSYDGWEANVMDDDIDVSKLS